MALLPIKEGVPRAGLSLNDARDGLTGPSYARPRLDSVQTALVGNRYDCARCRLDWHRGIKNMSFDSREIDSAPLRAGISRHRCGDDHLTDVRITRILFIGSHADVIRTLLHADYLNLVHLAH